MQAPKHCLQALDSVYRGALKFITNSKVLTHHCLLNSLVGWPALSSCRLKNWFSGAHQYYPAPEGGPHPCTLLQEVTAYKEDTDLAERYLFQQGILYRQFKTTKQLVVPQSVRELILNLSHSIPWAAHLGRYTTIARIRRHFYWPGLKRDVTQYCKSCPECQSLHEEPCQSTITTPTCQWYTL